MRFGIVEFFFGFKHDMNKTIWGKSENCDRVGYKDSKCLGLHGVRQKNVWIYILDIFPS